MIIPLSWVPSSCLTTASNPPESPNISLAKIVLCYLFSLFPVINLMEGPITSSLDYGSPDLDFWISLSLSSRSHIYSMFSGTYHVPGPDPGTSITTVDKTDEAFSLSFYFSHTCWHRAARYLLMKETLNCLKLSEVFLFQVEQKPNSFLKYKSCYNQMSSHLSRCSLCSGHSGQISVSWTCQSFK